MGLIKKWMLVRYMKGLNIILFIATLLYFHPLEIEQIKQTTIDLQLGVATSRV